MVFIEYGYPFGKVQTANSDDETFAYNTTIQANPSSDFNGTDHRPRTSDSVCSHINTEDSYFRDFRYCPQDSGILFPTLVSNCYYSSSNR